MAPPKPVALAPEGNYVFSTPLGEGTFGTVVKATHKIAKEHVAVKVLEKKRMLQADEIEVRAAPRAARKIARAPPRPPNLRRLAAQLVLGEHPVQLITRLVDAVAVACVDEEDEAIRLLVVVQRLASDRR